MIHEKTQEVNVMIFNIPRGISKNVGVLGSKYSYTFVQKKNHNIDF
jgi:hypothetical protein